MLVFDLLHLLSSRPAIVFSLSNLDHFFHVCKLSKNKIDRNCQRVALGIWLRNVCWNWISCWIIFPWVESSSWPTSSLTFTVSRSGHPLVNETQEATPRNHACHEPGDRWTVSFNSLLCRVLLFLVIFGIQNVFRDSLSNSSAIQPDCESRFVTKATIVLQTILDERFPRDF